MVFVGCGNRYVMSLIILTYTNILYRSYFWRLYGPHNWMAMDHLAGSRPCKIHQHKTNIYIPNNPRVHS